MYQLTEDNRNHIIQIAAGVSGDKLTDFEYKVLYDYFRNTKEMPDGIVTGRDGDPSKWIYEQLYTLSDSGTIEYELRSENLSFDELTK